MTKKNMDNLQDFLAKNRIDTATWESANIAWDTLRAIARDHEANREALHSAAELLARVIQRFPSVHSVRWRIKDSAHLLEKIVRKRAEKNEKYLEIAPENYFEIVTDLVGVRALHLFKDECFAIGDAISKTWTVSETPVAYVRQGDPQALTEKFRSNGWTVKEHPAGYRSVHYVVSTKPLQRTIFAEMQVRTIFEEGWSEIDHRVRYPNFSDDELVAYFLTIFNRLAGSADEMGTFVQGLVASLSSSAQAIAEEKQQKEKVLASMDKLLADFNESKKQDAESQAKVKALQEEVAKLKSLRVKDFVHPADRAGLASVLSAASAASGAAGLSGLDAAKKFYEEEQSRKDAISAWLKFKN